MPGTVMGNGRPGATDESFAGAKRGASAGATAGPKRSAGLNRSTPLHPLWEEMLFAITA